MVYPGGFSGSSYKENFSRKSMLLHFLSAMSKSQLRCSPVSMSRLLKVVNVLQYKTTKKVLVYIRTRSKIWQIFNEAALA